MTEEQIKQLNELKELERKEKSAENARKQRLGRDFCKQRWGMNVKEIDEKLSKKITTDSYAEKRLNEVSKKYGVDVYTLLDYMEKDSQVNYFKRQHPVAQRDYLDSAATGWN